MFKIIVYRGRRCVFQLRLNFCIYYLRELFYITHHDQIAATGKSQHAGNQVHLRRFIHDDIVEQIILRNRSA